MAKIPIIRVGGTRALRMHARVAHKLVQGGGFNYAEDAGISKPKRKLKAAHEARRAKAQEQESQASEAKGSSTAGPMTSARVAVKPTTQALKPSELQSRSVLELKTLAAKLGIKVKADDAKDDLVGRIYRYMRRDMRAAR